MNFAITEVPYWLSILFIILFFAPGYMIGEVAKLSYLNAGKSIDSAKKLKRNIILFYLIYLAVVGVVSATGFFLKNSLPPKIILFTVIPLLVFYFAYVWRSSWFKTVLEHSQLADLVWIHLFRFVGVFFLILYTYEALPKKFAFIGGWGDIATAGLAIPLIYLLKKKISFAKPLTWLWNTFGLIDIISVIVTALIITKASIAEGGDGVLQFATFPFSWIPALAPATIVFLHFATYVKLTKDKS